jgi:hypothetical protein
MPLLVPTVMHDKLHRWLFNQDNRYKVLKFLSEKKGFSINRDFGSIIDIERPIFVKDSRRFIIDVVVDLVSSEHCGISKNSNSICNGSVRSFAGKDISVIKGAIARRVIIDIKPDLTRSVSSAIGQIRTYAHFLSYCRWELGVKKTPSYPDMLLLTLDSNNDYDEMLFSQSIIVYHVNQKEIRR